MNNAHNILDSNPFLQAIQGKKASKTPIWLMRQAGRYLPEYREIRSKNSMLDVIRSPKLAAQVTLQPIERFGFDAAIIFADILNPLIGMGIDLDFVQGEGPKIFNPITSLADIERLKLPSPQENVGYTLEAIDLVASKLKDTALIGFSGAPFTLSSYLIGHSKDDGFSKLKTFIYQDFKRWDLLQTKLVSLVSDYLVAQIQAGANAVQIFDSWVGVLSQQQFCEFVLPYLKQIISNVKLATNNAPITYFGTGTSGLMPYFKQLGANCYGVDWRLSLNDARALIAQEVCLQGNLDPAIMLCDWQHVEKAALKTLEDSRMISSYIFNLGHGILPQTPVENVYKLVELIRNWK